MKHVVILASLALVVSGCSASGDLEKICNVDALSGVTATDPSERATQQAVWLEKNIKTTEGKNVFNALAMVHLSDRGVLLKNAAVEVGYTGACPTADRWAVEGAKLEQEEMAKEALEKQKQEPVPPVPVPPG